MAWEPLLWILAALGILAFGAAAAAVVLAVRFARHVRTTRVWDHTAFLPEVLVLVPCRGADAGLEENLEAILGQAYPRYRVAFCVDRLDDSAVPVIERARARHDTPSRLATAPDLSGTGGKALAILGKTTFHSGDSGGNCIRCCRARHREAPVLRATGCTVLPTSRLAS